MMNDRHPWIGCYVRGSRRRKTPSDQDDEEGGLQHNNDNDSLFEDEEDEVPSDVIASCDCVTCGDAFLDMVPAGLGEGSISPRFKTSSSRRQSQQGGANEAPTGPPNFHRVCVEGSDDPSVALSPFLASLSQFVVHQLVTTAPPSSSSRTQAHFTSTVLQGPSGTAKTPLAFGSILHPIHEGDNSPSSTQRTNLMRQYRFPATATTSGGQDNEDGAQSSSIFHRVVHDLFTAAARSSTVRRHSTRKPSSISTTQQAVSSPTQTTSVRIKRKYFMRAVELRPAVSSSSAVPGSSSPLVAVDLFSARQIWQSTVDDPEPLRKAVDARARLEPISPDNSATSPLSTASLLTISANNMLYKALSRSVSWESIAEQDDVDREATTVDAPIRSIEQGSQGHLLIDVVVLSEVHERLAEGPVSWSTVWSLIDTVGPQQEFFSATPVASDAQLLHKALCARFVTRENESVLLVDDQNDELLLEHTARAAPTRNGCHHPLLELLFPPDGTTSDHTLSWLCTLQQDADLDQLNAESIKIGNGIKENHAGEGRMTGGGGGVNTSIGTDVASPSSASAVNTSRRSSHQAGGGARGGNRKASLLAELRATEERLMANINRTEELRTNYSDIAMRDAEELDQRRNSRHASVDDDPMLQDGTLTALSSERAHSRNMHDLSLMEEAMQEEEEAVRSAPPVAASVAGVNVSTTSSTAAANVVRSPRPHRHIAPLLSKKAIDAIESLPSPSMRPSAAGAHSGGGATMQLPPAAIAAPVSPHYRHSINTTIEESEDSAIVRATIQQCLAVSESSQDGSSVMLSQTQQPRSGNTNDTDPNIADVAHAAGFRIKHGVLSNTRDEERSSDPRDPESSLDTGDGDEDEYDTDTFEDSEEDDMVRKKQPNAAPSHQPSQQVVEHEEEIIMGDEEEPLPQRGQAAVSVPHVGSTHSALEADEFQASTVPSSGCDDDSPAQLEEVEEGTAMHDGTFQQHLNVTPDHLPPREDELPVVTRAVAASPTRHQPESPSSPAGAKDKARVSSVIEKQMLGILQRNPANQHPSAQSSTERLVGKQKRHRKTRQDLVRQQQEEQETGESANAGGNAASTEHHAVATQQRITVGQQHQPPPQRHVGIMVHPVAPSGEAEVEGVNTYAKPQTTRSLSAQEREERRRAREAERALERQEAAGRTWQGNLRRSKDQRQRKATTPRNNQAAANHTFLQKQRASNMAESDVDSSVCSDLAASSRQPIHQANSRPQQRFVDSTAGNELSVPRLAVTIKEQHQQAAGDLTSIPATSADQSMVSEKADDDGAGAQTSRMMMGQWSATEDGDDDDHQTVSLPLSELKFLRQRLLEAESEVVELKTLQQHHSSEQSPLGTGSPVSSPPSQHHQGEEQSLALLAETALHDIVEPLVEHFEAETAKTLGEMHARHCADKELLDSLLAASTTTAYGYPHSPCSSSQGPTATRSASGRYSSRSTSTTRTSGGGGGDFRGSDVVLYDHRDQNSKLSSSHAMHRTANENYTAVTGAAAQSKQIQNLQRQLAKSHKECMALREQVATLKANHHDSPAFKNILQSAGRAFAQMQKKMRQLEEKKMGQLKTQEEFQAEVNKERQKANEMATRTEKLEQWADQLQTENERLSRQLCIGNAEEKIASLLGKAGLGNGVVNNGSPTSTTKDGSNTHQTANASTGQSLEFMTFESSKKTAQRRRMSHQVQSAAMTTEGEDSSQAQPFKNPGMLLPDKIGRDGLAIVKGRGNDPLAAGTGRRNDVNASLGSINTLPSSTSRNTSLVIDDGDGDSLDEEDSTLQRVAREQYGFNEPLHKAFDRVSDAAQRPLVEAIQTLERVSVLKPKEPSSREGGKNPYAVASVGARQLRVRQQTLTLALNDLQKHIKSAEGEVVSAAVRERQYLNAIVSTSSPTAPTSLNDRRKSSYMMQSNGRSATPRPSSATPMSGRRRDSSASRKASTFSVGGGGGGGAYSTYRAFSEEQCRRSSAAWQ